MHVGGFMLCVEHGKFLINEYYFPETGGRCKI